jgi:hypothetical protein
MQGLLRVLLLMLMLVRVREDCTEAVTLGPARCSTASGVRIGMVAVIPTSVQRRVRPLMGAVTDNFRRVRPRRKTVACLSLRLLKLLCLQLQSLPLLAGLGLELCLLQWIAGLLLMLMLLMLMLRC